MNMPMNGPGNTFMSMNTPMFPQMTMPVPPNMAFFPDGGQQCEEQPAHQTPASEAEASTEASTEHHEPRSPRRVDLIYIADEYPPIVLEAIEQQKAAEADDNTTVVSDDGDEIQQIPRAYIPRPAPRAASIFRQLFQYQSRGGGSDVRNGHRDMPSGSTSGMGRKMRNADRGRPQPCNASP
jgi:hypothetical protein